MVLFAPLLGWIFAELKCNSLFWFSHFSSNDFQIHQILLCIHGGILGIKYLHSWQTPFLSKLKLVCFISFTFSLLCRNGSNRFLTVSKKTVSAGTCSTVLNLTSNASHHIEHLLKKFPLNIKERQELQPKTERSTVTFETGV